MTKNIYNPMSKEFQDECKRFGLTGNQLTAKYKREGKSVKKDGVYRQRRIKASHVCCICESQDTYINKSSGYEVWHKHECKKVNCTKYLCENCYNRHDTKGNLIIGNGNYNSTNTCPEIKKDGSICGRSLIPGDVCQKKDTNGIKTDIWICANCYRNYNQKNDSNSYNNIRKLLADCRTGNQNPNSEQVKGDNHQELACKLYGFEDLNIKNDNHKSPLDCYDTKTGLYYQVQGRYYNSERGFWSFSDFIRDLKKKYESMICFCFSKDGKIVERIYKFPENIAKDKGSATIVKNSSRRPGWYEKYRIKDKDELRKANDIWKEIYKCWMKSMDSK